MKQKKVNHKISNFCLTLLIRSRGLGSPKDLYCIYQTKSALSLSIKSKRLALAPIYLWFVRIVKSECGHYTFIQLCICFTQSGLSLQTLSQLKEDVSFFLESINLVSRTVSSLCKCISYELKLVELGRSSAKFGLFVAKHRTRGVYHLLTTALTTFVYLLSFKLARQLRISRRRRLLIVYT